MKKQETSIDVSETNLNEPETCIVKNSCISFATWCSHINVPHLKKNVNNKKDDLILMNFCSSTVQGERQKYPQVSFIDTTFGFCFFSSTAVKVAASLDKNPTCVF